MAYEQKDNTGSLFKNDKKETDSHPDYTGSALIDGASYWMSGWLNETKDGRKYMKFGFKPKEDRQPGQRISDRAKATQPKSRDLDDEIPF